MESKSSSVRSSSIRSRSSSIRSSSIRSSPIQSSSIRSKSTSNTRANSHIANSLVRSVSRRISSYRQREQQGDLACELVREIFACLGNQSWIEFTHGKVGINFRELMNVCNLDSTNAIMTILNAIFFPRKLSNMTSLFEFGRRNFKQNELGEVGRLADTFLKNIQEKYLENNDKLAALLDRINAVVDEDEQDEDEDEDEDEQDKQTMTRQNEVLSDIVSSFQEYKNNPDQHLAYLHKLDDHLRTSILLFTKWVKKMHNAYANVTRKTTNQDQQQLVRLFTERFKKSESERKEFVFFDISRLKDPNFTFKINNRREPVGNLIRATLLLIKRALSNEQLLMLVRHTVTLVRHMVIELSRDVMMRDASYESRSVALLWASARKTQGWNWLVKMQSPPGPHGQYEIFVPVELSERYKKNGWVQTGGGQGQGGQRQGQRGHRQRHYRNSPDIMPLGAPVIPVPVVHVPELNTDCCNGCDAAACGLCLGHVLCSSLEFFD